MTESQGAGAIFDQARGLSDDGKIAVVGTVVGGEGVGRKALVTDALVAGSLGSDALDRQLVDAVAGSGGNPVSGVLELDPETRVFIDVFQPRPQLVIFGAVHAAQALDWFARKLGYRVVVVDARRALATRERFPETDQLITAWPDDAYQQLNILPSSSIAILSHDPKFDEPAIRGALDTPARYIGAVGSRKTARERLERLREGGVPEDQIARIHGPIGLDIGGGSPEEMAISILAEILSVAHGRGGKSLSTIDGAIHGRT